MLSTSQHSEWFTELCKEEKGRKGIEVTWRRKRSIKRGESNQAGNQMPPFLKRMGCLSGSLVSSTSVQKFFGRCSLFKWPFDEFVGDKVFSLSYFFTILGPSPVQSWSKLKTENYFWICQISTKIKILKGFKKDHSKPNCIHYYFMKGI